MLVLILILPACNSSTVSAENKTELIIFAAASMAGVLTEIAEIYTEKNPNISLVFNFDSSGTLRTQIQEGAEADLFISAAQLQMDQLDINFNTEGHDFILDGTRVDFLENKVVLVASLNNSKGIESFYEMVEALLAGNILMAMGNIDVPVGRYAHEVLLYFGLDSEALARTGVISFGSNVREVSAQVREGSVDMGIVYLTDALYDDLRIVDFATKEMTGGKVIYPAAVLNISENLEAAIDFLDFLTDEPAINIFTAWGFRSV